PILASPWIASFGRAEITPVPPSLVSASQASVGLLHGWVLLPGGYRSLVELDEDAFAMNLIGRHPVRSRRRQRGPNRTRASSADLIGRLHAREAQQCIHFTQACQEQHASEDGLEGGGRRRFFGKKVGVVAHRRRIGQHP